MFKSITLFALLLLFSTEVLAHKGHHHAHWTADFIHFLWLMPILFGCALITFAITYLDKKSKSRR
ncbi:hypothetical protein K6Q96_06565 [Grimontia kaedaensis]|uniref:DUF3955 domain-containing protein n=1 Tax=Grimontia kaedaensis TaxID=2872157 RepID=A0ABY4WXF7_9GAMM|nr:hypothetical protein [Grimontia kaedaensis]USH03653.1 hypothetical protein K6Q96_06565 [Grimontia kaedaensis]